MAGYIRTDTSNNISNGNIANADDINAEFNAIQAAFNTSTGHTHDGTVGSGGPVSVIGPFQEYVASALSLSPKTDNAYDLGTSSLRFKDLYFTGLISKDNLPVELKGHRFADTSANTQVTVKRSSNTINAGIRFETTSNVVNMGLAKDAIFAWGTVSDLSDVANRKVAFNLATGDIAWTGEATGDIPVDNLIGVIADANLPNLSASKITSGTFPSARLSGVYSGVTGVGTLNTGAIGSGFGNINIGSSTFTGNGSGINSINASNLATGTVASARISGNYGNITGTGTLNSGAIGTGFGNINIGTSVFTGNGTGLDTLNAAALAYGKVDADRLPETAAANQWVRERIANHENNVTGTYAFLRNETGGTVNPGSNYAGSSLFFTSTNLGGSTNSNGTWKCMGQAGAGQATLFLKVS